MAEDQARGMSEDMRESLEWVALDEIRVDSHNTRGHDTMNVEAIARSLERFGQQKPVVVRRDDRVLVAGEGTLLGAKQLGWDGLWVRLSDLDPLNSKAYSIADNRTAELAHWKADELGEQVLALAAADRSLLMGFSDEEISAFSGVGSEGDADKEDGGQSLEKLVALGLVEPIQEVKSQEVWKVGPHVMVCCDVVTEPKLWMGWFDQDMWFAPYPGPMVVHLKLEEERRFLLVQPDPWIAGHVIDNYRALNEQDSCKRLG